MRYEVTLIGGPLSGPLYREEYFPGITYHYSAADAEYVEGVLRFDGHFDIKEIEDAPKAEPQESAQEEPAKAEAKAKGKGGK